MPPWFQSSQFGVHTICSSGFILQRPTDIKDADTGQDSVKEVIFGTFFEGREQFRAYLMLEFNWSAAAMRSLMLEAYLHEDSLLQN